MKGKNHPDHIDFWYGVVSLVISGILWFWMIPTQIKTRKAYFNDVAMIPRFAVLIIAIMSVLLIAVSCYKAKGIRNILSLSAYSFDCRILLRQIVFLAAVLLYIRLLPIAGFVIATIPFTFVMLCYFGSRPVPPNLLIAVVFSIAAYILFSYAFRVNLPQGWLSI